MEIYFESYGCTANYNSTEIMKGLAVQAGFNITSNIDYSDLVVINSCIVKEPTEEKIRRRVFDLLNKNKKILLTGCMPRLNQKRFQSENLFLLDTSHIKNFVNIIRDISFDSYDPSKYLYLRNEIKLNLPKIPNNKFIGITQISEGCLGNCSYCITKFAKGKLFSYPIEDILKSIKKDLSSGIKEIWITSQDCSSYNKDNGKLLLPKLLNEILLNNLKKNKDFYIRLGMCNPDNVLKILNDLKNVYKNEKMFKFLHIPLQSGSDKILKLMKRNYTSEEFLKIIKEFRKDFPEMHISTDVIVGFPNETDEDFQKTFEIIKKIKPETINVSKFWARPKTLASKMPNQIDAKIKKQRAIKILKLHNEICNENQKRFLNTEHEVLVDQKGWSGTYLARNKNYKLFVIPSKEKILGKKLKIKVKNTTAHYLIGEII